MEKHCYIIMYDLRKPGRDYNSLYNAIKSYMIWGKITESTWAVVSDSNSSSIRDYLIKYIDTNDRLMVIQSGKHAAWTNSLASNDWLKQNLIK